jgi:cytosine/creatinine deaminase
MPFGFVDAGKVPRYVLRNARLPVSLLENAESTDFSGDFHTAHVVVDVERNQITLTGTAPADLPAIDMDDGILLPCFVDAHTHLDKGHIWPRRPNPDGSFMGALDAVGADREANWSAADVRARMEFGLRCAYAHGTRAIRTHIDSIGKQIGISWPVFNELRAAWRGRIELQAACLFGIDHTADDVHMANIIEAVKGHGGVLGCVTYMGTALEPGLDKIFRAAKEHGFALDFHVDETSDPAARSLSAIADAALSHCFKGHILAGHCCSLAVQGSEEESRTIEKVLRAGIAVVSLPMCNMYLQDRASTSVARTPRWRGVTSLHELAAAGVPVMVASDNTRDPFYAYGDLDMLEVLRESTRILHLDHPFGDWARAVSQTPARIMGLDRNSTLRSGASADIIAFRARSYGELLSRPQHDRVVIRAGRPIDRTPPDYRELDEFVGKPA